jgi:predicted nuclease of predicted toxin-antitoxin system
VKLLIDHQPPPTLKHYFLRKKVEALHVFDAGLAEAARYFSSRKPPAIIASTPEE